MKIQTEILQEVNKYVTLYRCNIVENRKKVGHIDGFIVNTENIEEAFYQIQADEIHWWRGTLEELNLKGEYVFIFKNYTIFPEYQFKERGIEASVPHQDWAVNMGCKYFLAYIHPVYDDPKLYKDKERVKKDTEFLDRYYIDYHTYKGKWFKLENPKIIMKVIS